MNLIDSVKIYLCGHLKGRVREEEKRWNFHSTIPSPNGTLSEAGRDQSQELHLGLPPRWQEPKYFGHLCCFSKCIGGVLVRSGDVFISDASIAVLHQPLCSSFKKLPECLPQWLYIPNSNTEMILLLHHLPAFAGVIIFFFCYSYCDRL